MNGECKSYRLNSPMSWQEFKAMPDEHKTTYIKLLRKKYNVPSRYIADMLGVHAVTFSKEIGRLGISEGKHCRGKCTKWDKEGFLAWWHGVDKLPTPVIEEPIVPIFEVTQEDIAEIEQMTGIKNLHVKAETYVEDDLPFEEPDPIQAEESVTVKAVPEVVTPINGSMQFKCPADQALNTLAQILGKTNCAISIMWRVIEEGGEAE